MLTYKNSYFKLKIRFLKEMLQYFTVPFLFDKHYAK